MNTKFIKERSIYQSVFFSIITCGLYGIYWFFSMTSDIYRLDGRTDDIGLEFLFTILSCGIYYLWIYYKLANSLNNLSSKYNRPSTCNPLMFAVLAIAQLGIVNYCIMQDELNALANID